SIVRGRVSGCRGQMRGPVIYTICQIASTERWKGPAAGPVEAAIPGGSAQGLTQTFSGAPSLQEGAEYVLFLWTGKSGLTQVIGLSQGVFDLKTDSKGRAMVRREAASEQMFDANGKPVDDRPVAMSVADLRERVQRALREAEQKGAAQ
ncbi:MAG: hypothetical protein ACRD7E_19455, partial [Bryobacteraceae bacterium]